MSGTWAPGRVDLSGPWAFAYLPGEAGQTPELLPADEARAVMPAPGYWDDHLEALRRAGWADRLRFNPDHASIALPMTGLAPDASLPYLVGVGQYETQFDAPQSGRVTVECPPAFIEAWLWLNGRRLAHQPHYSTGWSVPLDDAIRLGETNRLSIQVANTSPRLRGCITRGFKGYSAGLAGPVRLRVTGPARIADCYVRTDDAGEGLRWRVEIDRPGQGAELSLHWRVLDSADRSLVAEGHRTGEPGLNVWSTNANGLAEWSDRSPRLYVIELTVHDRDARSDVHRQSFGLRRIAADEHALRLNDKPLYLRGATEHAYFPETCTAPLDKSSYRRNIARIRQLGFNWLRFHTWIPPAPYLHAADEMGMLVQVEPPVGADERHWRDVLRACRKHPSVVIYCAGNEELLDEAKLDQLQRWAALQREQAPDALFNPQEALRGVEYGWREADLGEDAKTEPYPHNPRRLERLKHFSDCFGQFSWGWLSYHSADGDARRIDERLRAYERPCLSHEIGIHGSYLNLDLEHRHHQSRIGPEMYAAVRRHLRDRGLEHRAAEYHRLSCAWMRSLRKHAVETARRSSRLAGYDLLGAIDFHWHRTGYPCGVMNEFYEMKPDETAADVRRYNAASVLLLDHRGQWAVYAATAWRAEAAVSLFAEESLENATLEWTLRDDEGRVHRAGERAIGQIETGRVVELGQITLRIPALRRPAELTLTLRLRSETLELSNDWPLWVYPTPASLDESVSGLLRVDPALRSRWPLLARADEEVGHDQGDSERNRPRQVAAETGKPSETEPRTGKDHARAADLDREADGSAPPDPSARIQPADTLPGEGSKKVRLVDALSAGAVDGLERGERVVLLGSRPLPARVTVFQIACAGRAEGNLAFAVHDHPITRRLPHRGFCDWDWRAMIDHGDAVRLDALGVRPEPIIEVVSSFKAAEAQAALFELRVGRGRLLVCSLGLTPGDPASEFLLRACIDHARSDAFDPKTRLAAERLRELVDLAPARERVAATDEGFDERAALTSW